MSTITATRPSVKPTRKPPTVREIIESTPVAPASPDPWYADRTPRPTPPAWLVFGARVRHNLIQGTWKVVREPALYGNGRDRLVRVREQASNGQLIGPVLSWKVGEVASLATDGPKADVPTSHVEVKTPAPCCSPSESAPCSSCVDADEPATVELHTLPDDLSGADWQDEFRYELGPDVEPEPDREVLELIEAGALEQAEGEGPLGYATPECFAAVAEGRADWAREYGLVPFVNWVSRENRDDLLADDAIGDGWACYRERGLADAVRAKALELAAGPPARSLAEQVDDHARELRAEGSPLGDLLAERAESLAAQVRALDATTVEQFRDRRDAMLDADMVRAEARRAACCC